MKKGNQNPLHAQIENILRENREGSKETRRKRRWSILEAMNIVREKFGLQKVANLGMKHVGHVLETWKNSEAGAGTLHNKVSHLRWFVQKIGKGSLLRRRNKDLDLAPRDRHTKAGKIVPDEYYQGILAKIDGDDRLRVFLDLGRYCGLRFEEAALFRPHVDYQADGKIHLSRGTKGGRYRYVSIVTGQARKTIERARTVITEKHACLIPKDKTYRQWKDAIYARLRELDLGRNHPYEFHDLRRTFIHDEMDRLQAKGHSKEQAAKIVAKEVGHNRTEVLRWYGQWLG